MSNYQITERKANSHSMARRFLNPTSSLFTRHAELRTSERVLLLNCDDPVLARWAVDQVNEPDAVTALHPSHHVLRELAPVEGLAVSRAVYPAANQHGTANVVLLDIPPERDLVRAYLWTATQVLAPGGCLYLAGSNATGAKLALKDAAALFESVTVLGHKGGCQVARAIRPVGDLRIPPEWRSRQPWQPQMRSMARPEGQYTIVTMPGIFSWDYLDEGTALLLDHLGVEPDSDVLDMGCGYGIIGLVAARAGARVTMVDDNLLAVRCAEAGVRMNALVKQCTVLASDVTSDLAVCQFDLVLSNPPFRQGVEVMTGIADRFISEAYDVLRPGGRLRIVANRFLPYDRALHEVFGNMVVIAQDRRYGVLEAVRDA